MINLINVERKRIVNKKLWLIIIGFCIAITAIITINDYTSYQAYDSSGNVIISARDNLNESKKNVNRMLLNQEGLEEILLEESRTNYTYDINSIRLLLSIYPDKKFSEISVEDLDSFYTNRLKLIEDAATSKMFGELTTTQVEKVKELSSQMETPIISGYAEGWKNINNNLTVIIMIALGIISIVLLPIYGETSKTDMSEICIATKDGKRKFIIAKLLVGIQVSTLIYFIIIGCMAIFQFCAFGLKGFDLMIQSDQYYIFSICNITFLEQFLLSILIGYIAVLFMTSIILFCTSITGKLLDGGIITTFIWIIMVSIPYNHYRGYRITHYISGFLPVNIIKFGKIFRMNDTYQVFEVMIPAYICIPIVVVMISFLLFVIILMIQKKKITFITK
ncbi:hypothetical protein [Clostridium sp.]|uniref:hypothetical protein n=1 Tax=Clostridium sp. TaxID=1506 RepID=UPI003F2B21A0